MLCEDEQYDVVFAKGKFLDIHLDGNIKFVLYALDIFFVEVLWDIEQDSNQGLPTTYFS